MNLAFKSENSIPDLEIPAQFYAVDQYMRRGVEEQVFPGAVLLVGRAGRELFFHAYGTRSFDQKDAELAGPMQLETVFDIASLTQILVTTTLIMKLVEAGKVSLDHKVCRYIEGFSVFGKSSVSIAHLLSHSSGLPHWMPFFEDLLKANAGARMGIMTSRGAREFVITQIKRMELKFAAGTKQVYSDLGFILLGHLIELLTGLSLERAAQAMLFQPLGLRFSSFVDLSMIRRRGIHPVRDLIAPTEHCTWRKRLLCGEVHDDNAWAMGGIAGHSGVFSNAHDLHLFSVEMIRAYHGESAFLGRQAALSMWRGVDGREEQTHHFGWEVPNRDNLMLEAKLSPGAVGQCGFTGCSLWIEPETAIDVVLLTNRVHPSRSNRKIRTFRPELHALVIDSLNKL